MKRGPKGNTISGLNVGRLVKQVMFDRGMNKTRLARRMDRSGPSIKNSINQTSLHAYLIWELSVALNHNFFADLAQQLDAATNRSLSGAEVPTTQLQQLQTEYNRLKEERDYLRKAVDLLSNS